MGLAQVGLIVRTETRRRWRTVWADDTKKYQHLVIYGLWALFVPVAVLLAYDAGGRVASGAGDGVVSFTGTVVAGLLLFLVFVGSSQVLGRGVLPSAPEGLLIAASHRDVVASHLVLETLGTLSMVGSTGILVGLSYGLGAGSAAGAVFVTLTITCVTVVGTLVGVTLGLGLRTASAQIALVAKYRSALAALGFLAYLATLATGHLDSVFGWIVAGIALIPLDPTGHLALLGTHPDADPTQAGLALVATGASLGVVYLVAASLTARLWYDVPVQPAEGERSSAMGRLPHVSPQVGTVARKTWLRARRSPIRLLYAVYPAVFLLSPLASAVTTGRVPTWTPPALVLYAAWAAGAAVALNPIGDETPVLPVTVTTPITGGTHVRGLWLAGAVVGAPLAGVVCTVAGVLAGYGPVDTALLALVGIAVAALAPGLAAGNGATFPETTASEIVGDAEAVTPSFLAFFGFTIELAVLSAPLWAVPPLGVRNWVAGLLGVPGPVAGGLAAVLAIVLVGLGSLASARSAARRFDGYTVE